MKVQSALLAAITAGVVVSQTNDTSPPSEVPFYGLSPPVYPTREFATAWPAKYVQQQKVLTLARSRWGWEDQPKMGQSI